MNWRPPIKDPVSANADDHRKLCPKCNREMKVHESEDEGDTGYYYCTCETNDDLF